MAVAVALLVLPLSVGGIGAATGDPTAELTARIAYETQVNLTVAPSVRALPSYGGMYFDQSDGGRLVILLTEDDAALRTSISSRMPSGPELKFLIVDQQYEALRRATSSIFDVWGPLTGLPMPYQTALDVRGNAVVAYVDQTLLIEATAQQAKVADALGVTVIVESGRPAEAQACTSRDNCTSPIKDAVRVRKGSTTGAPCTMAFQVRTSGGDEQFLTAGHCALTGSNSWYHQGYGYLGGEMQSLYTSGYDAVRIQMPDTQSTYRVYGDDYVSSWMWPTVGQLVKQNNGQSDFIGWGEILDDWHCWTNSGQQLCGAKMTGVGGVGGDSGAPVYVPYTHLYALGINFGGDGSGNGLFTRVGDVLAYMDVDLVVGP